MAVRIAVGPPAVVTDSSRTSGDRKASSSVRAFIDVCANVGVEDERCWLARTHGTYEPPALPKDPRAHIRPHYVRLSGQDTIPSNRRLDPGKRQSRLLTDGIDRARARDAERGRVL